MINPCFQSQPSRKIIRSISVAGGEYHPSMLIAARPFFLVLLARMSIVDSHLYLSKKWNEKLITHFDLVWSLLPDRLIQLTVSLGVV